jgi:hypothetical protein
MLGGRLVNEMGGYEFLAIPGQIPIRDAEKIYSNTEAANFDPQKDLNLFMTGNFTFRTLTLEQIYSEAMEELDLEAAHPETISVDGAPGLSADLTRTLPDGTALFGRLVVVEVNPHQRFIMLGEGTAEAWDAELDLLYDAVLASVRFFEIDLP